MAWQLRCAPHAEHVLNSNALDAEVLVAALEALQKDICPGNNEGEFLPPPLTKRGNEVQNLN